MAVSRTDVEVFHICFFPWPCFGKVETQILTEDDSGSIRDALAASSPSADPSVHTPSPVGPVLALVTPEKAHAYAWNHAWGPCMKPIYICSLKLFLHRVRLQRRSRAQW